MVACYNLDGKFVRTYKSARAASKSLHLHPRTIEKCIRGESKTAKGMLWRRFNDNNVPAEIEPLGKRITTISARPIALIDENNQIIKTYPSIRKASIENKIDPKSIRDVLNGKSKFAKGNRYRYLSNNECNIYTYEKKEYIVKEKNAVVQLSFEEQYIRTFKSVYAAAKELNKSPQAIYDCLKGKYKTAYGYKWRYKHN